jgi:hypothetical protein
LLDKRILNTVKFGYVWLQSLEDANLSALSEPLLPASRPEFISSVSKVELLSSEGYAVGSLGSRSNLPPRCLSQTEALSNETHTTGLVGSEGNLLAPSYSKSIHKLRITGSMDFVCRPEF